MKQEAWLFGVCTIFFGLITPAYWFLTEDWTGTTALLMAAFLALMVTLYLGVHAAKMDARPEDRQDGEIAEGAGELGFFPPYSWWPLWCAMAMSACTYAVALAAWWLLLITGVLMVIAIAGWVFEYYRGEFAH